MNNHCNRDNTFSHHSKHRPRDINECVRRQNSLRQETTILSSSSPSAPSSPSPPIRTRWWPPRTESVSPRTSFHRSGPEQSRGGWHRQFQHHFPTSSGMVFSAPHGVRTARSHHAWRGNININQHARHRPSTRNRFYDSSSELFSNNPVSRKRQWLYRKLLQKASCQRRQMPRVEKSYQDLSL